MKTQVRSLALLSGLRIQHCGERRPAATAPMWPLEWKPPYATREDKKNQKKKKKKKKKKALNLDTLYRVSLEKSLLGGRFLVLTLSVMDMVILGLSGKQGNRAYVGSG